MECSDIQNVSSAKFQLCQDVNHWWECTTRAMTTENRTNLTWEDFKAVFGLTDWKRITK